jgi:hypothetical protein
MRKKERQRTGGRTRYLSRMPRTPRRAGNPTPVVSRKWIEAKLNEVGGMSVNRAALYRRDLGAQKGRMGRTTNTATTEKPLPLPLQFLAAWIGMW